MGNQSLTVRRNKQIVGNNSKSYNDKHPENPISLRPVRNAIQKMPRIADEKGQLHFDHSRADELRLVGSVLPRMVLRSYLNIRGLA